MKQERVCKTCKNIIESQTAEDTMEVMRQKKVTKSLRNIRQSSFVTIHVVEAYVPNMANFPNAGLVGHHAARLLGQIGENETDAFVSIEIDNEWRGRTEIVWNDQRPKWSHEFFFKADDPDKVVTLSVCHKPPVGKDVILGKVDIKLRNLTPGVFNNEVHELDPQYGKGFSFQFDIMCARKSADLLPLCEA